MFVLLNILWRLYDNMSRYLIWLLYFWWIMWYLFHQSNDFFLRIPILNYSNILLNVNIIIFLKITFISCIFRSLCFLILPIINIMAIFISYRHIMLYFLLFYQIVIFLLFLYSIKSCNLSQLSNFRINIFLTWYWHIILTLIKISFLCISFYLILLYIILSYTTILSTLKSIILTNIFSMIYNIFRLIFKNSLLTIILGRCFIFFSRFFY